MISPGSRAGLGVARERHLAGVFDDALVERSPHRHPAQPGQALARQRVAGGAQADVDGVADGACGVAERAREVEAIADAQRGSDLVGVLRLQLVAGAARHPVQLGPDVEQAPVGVLEPATGHVGSQPRDGVGELGQRERVEQLHVAQTPAAVLEVRFGAVRDLAAAPPALVRLVQQVLEAAANTGPPLPVGAGDQQPRQFLVADDVARVEHAHRRGDVRRGDLQCLRHGAHAVVELDVRVPQRIPEPIGNSAHLSALDVVVQQDQVEIRVGQHLAPPESTDRDDRQSALGGDTEFGTLGVEPELVEVDESQAQRGRVEAPPRARPVPAPVEQGVDGPDQVVGTVRCGAGK